MWLSVVEQLLNVNCPLIISISLLQAVPKIFSAGLDIKEMCGKSAEHYAEFWRAVQEMWLKLYKSNMVTIAAINASLLCLYPDIVESPT